MGGNGIKYRNYGKLVKFKLKILVNLNMVIYMCKCMNLDINNLIKLINTWKSINRTKSQIKKKSIIKKNLKN
jgi:hypothetical protein